jgi:hypothetical protein
MKQTFSAIALAVFMSTTVASMVQAGATSNQGGPQSIGGGPPQAQGPAGIPQSETKSSSSDDKGEDVSVDRDPAPRVPKVDKP